MRYDNSQDSRRPEDDIDIEGERQALISEVMGEELEQTPEEAEEAARKEWEEKLQVFGAGIEAEAEEFERIRKPKELQMLEDMRQYLGVEEFVDKNKNSKSPGSDLNVNITRKKTNTADAKLSDMLFPTDDKNWDLTISPIPTAAIHGMPRSAPGQQPQPQPQAPAEQQQEIPADAGLMQQGHVPGAPSPDGQPQNPMSEMMGGQPPEEAPPQLTPEEQAEKDAKARCELMVKEIDDQLAECNYNAAGREAIRSGCILGTGVLKGPVLLGKSRRAWIEKKDGMGNVAYILKDVIETKPAFEFVSAWDFFPEMSATRVDDCEVIFQRHWMTRRDLIRLAKREDFLTDQVRRVLKTSPNRVPPDYLTQLRAMGEITAVGDEKRYVVWERHGPVRREDLQLCGVIDADEEEDPLEEYQGVVWVCQGIVIKAAVNPMDTEDQPFSVFNFERDDSCIFGYGVPYLMRQPAKVVKFSWRMIMDNAALSVGGQVIVNKSIIEPAKTPDGKISWDITPLKLWLMKDKNGRAQDAFHVFEFPNHQNELAAIFNMARQLADEETGIPVIAEGEQGVNGPGGAQTAHGMEMLMNNHNIVMRRAVKNWDDNQTVKNIGRIYDFNMQNNPNNDIKGDFQAVARGTAALLQKETQARNILNLVNFLMTPVFAPWSKVEPIAKKLVASMQHDADEFIKTKAEYDKDVKAAQAAAAQQQPQGNNNLEVQKMKNDLAYRIHQDKLADSAADRQFKAALADIERETEIMKLAQVRDLSLAKISADLQKIHEQSRAERTLMADDLKAKMALPSGKVEG